MKRACVGHGSGPCLAAAVCLQPLPRVRVGRVDLACAGVLASVLVRAVVVESEGGRGSRDVALASGEARSAGQGASVRLRRGAHHLV